MLSEHLIVRTSLCDELYFFQWPKSGPGSSRGEKFIDWQLVQQNSTFNFVGSAFVFPWHPLHTHPLLIAKGFLASYQVVHKSMIWKHNDQWFRGTQITDLGVHKSMICRYKNRWYVGTKNQDLEVQILQNPGYKILGNRGTNLRPLRRNSYVNGSSKGGTNFDEL